MIVTILRNPVHEITQEIYFDSFLLDDARIKWKIGRKVAIAYSFFHVTGNRYPAEIDFVQFCVRINKIHPVATPNPKRFFYIASLENKLTLRDGDAATLFSWILALKNKRDIET